MHISRCEIPLTLKDLRKNIPPLFTRDIRCPLKTIQKFLSPSAFKDPHDLILGLTMGF
jgi:hypothetical protein